MSIREKNRINRNKANRLFDVYMDTYPDIYVSAGEDGSIDIKGKFSLFAISDLALVLGEHKFDYSSDLAIDLRSQ